MDKEEKLKPCPFCGRKLKFHKITYINKFGKKIIEQYYMHDYSNENVKCILDELMMPLVIGAGDATKQYIGEYAELWNRRVKENE